MNEERNRKKPHDVTDLQEYRQKRHFDKTQEPEGGFRKPSPAPIFVVQKHAARNLHYDLRLEADGVLLSWAVPIGPTYDPSEKRLAVHVEDHPLEYSDFEGLIPEKQYGAGTVMVWDKGTWRPVGDWRKGLAEGHITFRLDGRKLKGQWKLVRTGIGKEEDKDNWLLIKSDDEEARRWKQFDVTSEETLSAKTGRSLDEIASQRTAFWQGTREEKGEPAAQKPPEPPQATGNRAPWPDYFLPQLATLVSRLPEGPNWLSEIKFDGYRLIARINRGSVVLSTRRGQNWTGKFPGLARQLSRLPVESAILDGEVVVMNPDGTTDFQKLQNILKHPKDEGLVYYAFDIPYYQGRDLSSMPLIERKTVLRELLITYEERIPSVRFSEHVERSGEQVLRDACRYSVEGIIAKRADSPYLQKRTKYWVKKKCINRQEFVIGGFTAPKGARSFFGSLVLGYYNDARELVYCGNVGTGFNEQTIKTVYRQLEKLEQPDSPFAGPIDDPRSRSVRWVAPRLVAEVQFSEWTEGGNLRHPSFIGIREDKNADEITLEKEAAPPDDVSSAEYAVPAAIIPVKLTNPGKIMYPDQGLTKRDLAEYYIRVADKMLPEIVNRPLVLVRCPEGIPRNMREDCFFQKHLKDDIPESIRSAVVDEKGQEGLYPVVDDLNGILSLVQLGVLEIHMLGSRANDVAHPDRMTFDLDPAPDVSGARLIEATLYIRDWLAQNGMKSFLKLTGGKGIHIVVRIKPVLTWDELKKMSKAIALDLMSRKPSWFVVTVSKKRRVGRILIDYMRNGLGASTIAPFSTRAQPGAPVALPVSEAELTEDLFIHPVTVRNAVARLKKMQREPWQGMYQPPSRA